MCVCVCVLLLLLPAGPTQVDCYCRSKMHYGTSSMLAASVHSCQCMNVFENGTIDQDCNCLFLPYLDGSSFSGFRAEPVAAWASNGRSCHPTRSGTQVWEGRGLPL